MKPKNRLSSPKSEHPARWRLISHWRRRAEHRKSEKDLLERGQKLAAQNDADKARLADIQRRLTLLSNESKELRGDPSAQSDLDDRLAELQADAEAMLKEGPSTEEINAINTGLKAYSARMRKSTRRYAKGNLIVQLATVAIGLQFPPFTARGAHAIHLDYYTAVAAIAPVLLVAGFVELAVLGQATAGWGVLSFGVPAVGAAAAALLVLATHNSTPAAFYLTIWGLGATLLSLTLLIVGHASMSRGT